MRPVTLNTEAVENIYRLMSGLAAEAAADLQRHPDSESRTFYWTRLRDIQATMVLLGGEPLYDEQGQLHPPAPWGKVA